VSPWQLRLEAPSERPLLAESGHARPLSGLPVHGFDVEAADFNGDKLIDIYLACYDGRDYLLFQK